MKRWKSIPIVMLTSVSLTALTACEEPRVDALVFENLAQCLDDTTMSRDECEANYKEARAQHAAVAPKYASKADCLADFGAGQCEEAPYKTQSGGSVFMPLMMGYMMGSMIGGRRSMVSQPLYRSNKSPGIFRTADSRNVGTATGRTQVAKSATSRPSFKSSTTSRGGFGASGRRFGSSAT
jgi:uncharacterized protein YgiB involved in biofilm formation